MPGISSVAMTAPNTTLLVRGMANNHQPGLPRSYFHARIAGAIHELIAQRTELEESRPRMMISKVNLEEAANRLLYCPVCGHQLASYPGYPTARSCEHGEFEIKDVWLDGDVSFEYKMTAPESLEPVEVGKEPVVWEVVPEPAAEEEDLEENDYR